MASNRNFTQPLRAHQRSVRLTLHQEHIGSFRFYSDAAEKPPKLVRFEVIEKAFGNGTYKSLKQPDHWEMIGAGWFEPEDLVQPDFPDNAWQAWAYNYAPDSEPFHVFQSMLASGLKVHVPGFYLSDSDQRIPGAYLSDPEFLPDVVSAVEKHTSTVTVSPDIIWIEGFDEEMYRLIFPRGKGIKRKINRYETLLPQSQQSESDGPRRATTSAHANNKTWPKNISLETNTPFTPDTQSSKSLVRQLSDFYGDHDTSAVFLSPLNASKFLYFIQKYPDIDGVLSTESTIVEPQLTNREVLLRYYDLSESELELIENLEEFELEYFYLGQGGLDGQADMGNYLDSWLSVDSPMALAYEYLEGLGIGQDDPDKDVVEIRFVLGPLIPGGGSLKEVHCPDEYAASLLQAKLIDMGEPTKIFVVPHGSARMT